MNSRMSLSVVKDGSKPSYHLDSKKSPPSSLMYPIDHAPHIGQHQGIDFVMGYCGSGVARATYFGQKMAYKILGDQDRGRTAFDDLPFQTKPLYTGNPWFMPIVLNWHRIADRLGL